MSASLAVIERGKSIISKRRAAYNSIKNHEQTITGSKQPINIPTVPTLAESAPLREEGDGPTGAVTVVNTKYYSPEVYRSDATKMFAIYTLLLLSFVNIILSTLSPSFRINAQRSLVTVLNFMTWGGYEELLEQCAEESCLMEPLYSIGPAQALMRTSVELVEPGRWMGACEGWGLRTQAFGAFIWIGLLLVLTFKYFLKVYN